jgi:hypothetical protein
VQVAGGVDTGLDRLNLARPQEQLDEQTRRFREQVGGQVSLERIVLGGVVGVQKTRSA